MDQMPGRFPPPPEYTAPPGNAPGAGGPYPMDMGRIFEITFSLFRFRWRTFLAAAFAIMIPVSIVFALASLYTSNLVLDWYSRLEDLAAGGTFTVDASVLYALAIGLVFGALFAIGTYVAEAAITHAAFATYNGQPASATRSIRSALGRIGALALAYLLTFLAALGIAFLGILFAGLLFIATSSGGRIAEGPGVFFGLLIFVAAFALLIFLTLRWALVVPVIVVEGAGGVEALRRSWRLVSGSTWRVLGYVIVIGLIVGAVAFLLQLALTLVVRPSSFSVTGALGQVDPGRAAILNFGTSMIGALLMPFSAIAVMLLYLDLRWRRGEAPTQPSSAEAGAPVVPDLPAD